MNRSLFAIALLAAAVTLGACSSDDSGDGATETETSAAVTGETAATGNGQAGGFEGGQSSQKQNKSGIKITTSDSAFGTILFDGNDQAIYLFDKENSPTSECYGDCASAWPPVLTKGDPQATGGAESKLLGTTKRDDGTTQVTYADRPLYYYVDDPPGEVLCHNVVEFGGNWQVVQPDGNPAA